MEKISKGCIILVVQSGKGTRTFLSLCILMEKPLLQGYHQMKNWMPISYTSLCKIPAYQHIALPIIVLILIQRLPNLTPKKFIQ